MGISVADNFSYLGGKPLDGRIQYATLAAMKAMADATLYEGCEAYCVATDKYYKWKSSNTVDASTGKWREVESGGGSGLPSGGTQGQYLVKQSSTEGDADWQSPPTVDNAPTQNSNNPVKSGGVYTSLADKVDKVSGKGLSTNDYTTEEKTKLAGLSNYELPIASASVLGGIKVGNNLSIDNMGYLSATGSTTNYSVEIQAVGVKWINNKDVYALTFTFNISTISQDTNLLDLSSYNIDTILYYTGYFDTGTLIYPVSDAIALTQNRTTNYVVGNSKYIGAGAVTLYCTINEGQPTLVVASKTMTGYNTGGDTVSASSDNNGPAWKAFSNADQIWNTDTGKAQWLEYQFADYQRIGAFGLTCLTWTYDEYITYVLEYYNSSSEAWVALTDEITQHSTSARKVLNENTVTIYQEFQPVFAKRFRFRQIDHYPNMTHNANGCYGAWYKVVYQSNN